VTAEAPGQATLWPRTIGPEHGQARESDPPTAHGAAARVRPGTQRYQLLAAHRSHPGGLTDEEACAVAELSPTSEYATRCSELRNAGYLVDTTAVRLGDAGHPRLVRCITGLGLAALAMAESR